MCQLRQIHRQQAFIAAPRVSTSSAGLTSDHYREEAPDASHFLAGYPTMFFRQACKNEVQPLGSHVLHH